MTFHTFTSPPVVLSLRIPRGWLHFNTSTRGGWYALTAAAVLNEVRNIKRLEIGVNENGPFLDVTVQPSSKYTVEQAIATLDGISERFDGMNPRVLAKEWEATPENKRARFKIVRDDVQAT